MPMRFPALAILLFIIALLSAVAAPALELLSVSPRKAEPGQLVRVTGGPFEEAVTIFIGDHTVQPTSLQERELIFKVPDLAEGEYLLFLRSNGEDSRVFRLEVKESPPLIYAVNPASVDVCSNDSQVWLDVEGENFQRGSILLLDGRVVPSDFRSSRSIALLPPPLEGGLHEIQVVNPSGAKSLPRALLADDQPEIYTVFQGEDRVNSYELIIQGKNFFYDSKLLVDGQPIRTVSGIPAQTGVVRYVDCNTLVYHRFPYSRELKEVSLRIVNSSGKQTPVFNVTIP